MELAPDRTGITRIGAAFRGPLGRAARSLALLAGVGWLVSGSCVVAACYEECDPCFQVCKCHTVCQNPVAGGTGLRIAAFDARVLADDSGRFVRVVRVAVGPSLEFVPDAEPDRLGEFARRILDVNADLFTSRRDPVWRLDVVHAFPENRVLQFALVPERGAAPRANTVSLLFDARGRLLEADHVVERAPD